MYIINDTDYIQKKNLKPPFLYLLAANKRTPNVRVAALKHGDGLGSHLPRKYPSYSLSTPERNDLGGRPGGPYMFSPNPKDPTDPFKDPSLLADATITAAINPLVFAGADEYLYPAIDLARRMIIAECPRGVDLTAKPWCYHKVIMLLGRGEPGKAADDYFHQGPQLDGVHDELPEALLDQLNHPDVNIKLHALCVANGSCRNKIYRLRDVYPQYAPYRYYTFASIPRLRWDIGYRGADILRELATQTGGVFHGSYP